MSNSGNTDVNVNSVTIKANDGIEYDVTNAFANIVLYEDVFSNTIHGQITISDGTDMWSRAPLYGEEQITLKMSTPGLDPKFDVTFVGIVYRISDRLEVSDKTQLYTMHFASPEMIINENKQISKYFKGKVHDNLKLIVQDPMFLGSKKQFEFETVNTEIKFASPYWSPFKIINWMTQRTLTKEGAIPDFVFFETLQSGFQFRSLSENFDTRDTGLTFRRSEDSVRSMDESYSRIQELYVDDVADYLKRLQSGMFASRLITANATTKNLQMTSLTSHDYFSKTKHLNKFDMMGKQTTFAKNAHMVSYIDQEYGFDGQRDIGFNQWLLQRNNFFQRIHSTFKCDIKVRGRFDVTVGRTCNIQFNQTRQVGERDTGSLINEYMTGRYLITAICHTIDVNRRHTMTLQCCTDSVAKELP